MSLVQDCYYWGHRSIFGHWRYWSLGVREGNLIGYSSRGEEDFFAEHDAFITQLHSPMLGGAPEFKFNQYYIGASAPLWLLLPFTAFALVLLELKSRAKIKTGPHNRKTCAQNYSP